jgi:hypothetical protein
MIRSTVEQTLEFVIYFIYFIKVIFLISFIGHIIFKNFNPDLDKKLVYLRNRTEFIFTICMAILLIFIFTPWVNNKKYINNEMSFIFYLFGFVIILTADWELFIKEAPWMKTISNIIS